MWESRGGRKNFSSPATSHWWVANEKCVCVVLPFTSLVLPSVLAPNSTAYLIFNQKLPLFAKILLLFLEIRSVHVTHGTEYPTCYYQFFQANLKIAVKVSGSILSKI